MESEAAREHSDAVACLGLVGALPRSGRERPVATAPTSRGGGHHSAHRDRRTLRLRAAPTDCGRPEGACRSSHWSSTRSGGVASLAPCDARHLDSADRIAPRASCSRGDTRMADSPRTRHSTGTRAPSADRTRRGTHPAPPSESRETPDWASYSTRLPRPAARSVRARPTPPVTGDTPLLLFGGFGAASRLGVRTTRRLLGDLRVPIRGAASRLPTWRQVSPISP